MLFHFSLGHINACSVTKKDQIEVGGGVFHASLLTVREIVHNRGMQMRGEELQRNRPLKKHVRDPFPAELEVSWIGTCTKIIDNELRNIKCFNQTQAFVAQLVRAWV